MDGQRFDTWTRWFVREVTRRGSLKSLTSLALAAVGAGPLAATRKVEANTGTGCVEYGLPCSPGECCAPYTCRAGNPTSICGDCLGTGTFCADSGECCSGACSFSFFHLWWVCEAPPSVDTGGGHARHRKKKKKKKNRRG